MEITNQHIDTIISGYIDRYIRRNRAATILHDALVQTGIGIRPLIDHIAIRTLDVQERALEFEALGYTYDDRMGVIERDTWWATVYRKPGFPAVYLDQSYTDARGATSPIPKWVEQFTDAQLHHIGICVDRLEHAIEQLTQLGLTFSGEITGEPGSEFRQIYTEPELVDGEHFTVLELIERRWGYMGFLSPLPAASDAGGI